LKERQKEEEEDDDDEDDDDDDDEASTHYSFYGAIFTANPEVAITSLRFQTPNL
jgi:hypothetical protein